MVRKGKAKARLHIDAILKTLCNFILSSARAALSEKLKVNVSRFEEQTLKFSVGNWGGRKHSFCYLIISTLILYKYNFYVLDYDLAQEALGAL